MSKSQDNKRKRDVTAAVVAEMYGVTPRYVRMIRDGERINKKILETYTRITAQTKSVIESAKESVQKKTSK